MGLFSKLFGIKSKAEKQAEITAFNYYLCFKFLPKQIEAFNNRHDSFEKYLDFSQIITEKPKFAKFAKGLKVTSSGINNWSNLSLHLVKPVSNEIMGEVAMAIITYDSCFKVARLFTLEYSIGNFAVCEPTSESHSVVEFVDNAEQFAAFCIKDVINSTKEMADSY
jgi:hypothetical protein